MTDGISRRKFLGGVASAGVGGLAMAGILAACGKAASGGEDTGAAEAAPTTQAGPDRREQRDADRDRLALSD